MQILLTTTIALGFFITINNQSVKAWGYEAVDYRPADCLSNELDRAFGREAAAYQRSCCDGYSAYGDRGWRYPKYFTPNCRLFCRRDFLGNLYGCFTRCI
ncbi:MAG TPA: hypothetical protein VMW10_10285 [Alphaproteobacteria bacterium]|nr:hypothetical protein [Alphaproteobacteria bacterium]